MVSSGHEENVPSDGVLEACFFDLGILKSTLALMTDGHRTETKELIVKRTKELIVKRVGQGRIPPFNRAPQPGQPGRQRRGCCPALPRQHGRHHGPHAR